MRLAAQEENHAARWSERIAAATGHAPDRAKVERGLSWFQRISDPSVVLTVWSRRRTRPKRITTSS